MHFLSIFVVFALGLSATLAVANVKLDEQWNTWKQTNKKHYSKGEEIVRYETISFSFFHRTSNSCSRRAIWESNLKTVEEHNAKADQGLYTYWLGMNQFADKV